MLSEGVIFQVWVAALISLQHTMLSPNTGASYSYPIVISSMLITIGLCLALSIVSLVVLGSMTTDFGDGVALCLLRCSRAVCGALLIVAMATGAMAVTSADMDTHIGMFFSTHLFAVDRAIFHYGFAILFVLILAAAIICALIACHSLLRTVMSRIKYKTVSRISWNVNIACICITEIQLTARHNIVTGFESRLVFISLETLIAVPTLFVLDLLFAKFYILNQEKNGVLWAKIMCVFILALVVGGWAILVLLQPSLQSLDYCYVNAVVGCLQVVGTLIDMSNALGRVSAQPRLQVDRKDEAETSQVMSASGSKRSKRVSLTANIDMPFDGDGSRLEPFNPMVAGNLYSHRALDPIRSGAHQPSLSNVFRRQFRLTHNSDVSYQAQFPYHADSPRQYLDGNADLIKKMK